MKKQKLELTWIGKDARPKWSRVIRYRGKNTVEPLMNWWDKRGMQPGSRG